MRSGTHPKQRAAARLQREQLYGSDEALARQVPLAVLLLAQAALTMAVVGDHQQAPWWPLSWWWWPLLQLLWLLWVLS